MESYFAELLPRPGLPFRKNLRIVPDSTPTPNENAGPGAPTDSELTDSEWAFAAQQAGALVAEKFLVLRGAQDAGSYAGESFEKVVCQWLHRFRIPRRPKRFEVDCVFGLPLTRNSLALPYPSAPRLVRISTKLTAFNNRILKLSLKTPLFAAASAKMLKVLLPFFSIFIYTVDTD
jgi:hypothetical protein